MGNARPINNIKNFSLIFIRRNGYFQRGKKEEEEIDLGFAKDYPEDSFEKEEDLTYENNQSLLEIVKNLFIEVFP